ncbi:putative galacturonosyltransferase 13 isoform X3 [Gossypium australe]|uniref:Putative galacturonosyltransferase 13 isoform X3 n=1 Tax=Gossypium australe TaxID=47621 RepID=A0A5B6W289_9ROSI|nr:putative galacturonosyltransferase 13 isoform X3 [Gossypium australe]
MQLHISPSMRSITISSNNGFTDLMKIKVAARHISYRTLFHTILIVAFLLPFVFILTALVTLEGANKCSSFDCFGRRFGPRFLGRVDDSGVSVPFSPCKNCFFFGVIFLMVNNLSSLLT